MRPRHTQTRRAATAAGFRSGFEQDVSLQLREAGVDFEYEPKDRKVSYVPKPKTYLPDFVLPNGVILEVKGRFTAADRVKHLLIKEQYPELDIRFVFMVDNKITKVSKTRYSDWCEKHGFQYAFVTVPESWYK